MNCQAARNRAYRAKGLHYADRISSALAWLIVAAIVVAGYVGTVAGIEAGRAGL